MRLDPTKKLEPDLTVNLTRKPVWPVDMPPGLISRIFFASESFVRNFWHVLKGNTPGESTLAAQRKRICNKCKFQREGVCIKCGCFLRAKTWLIAEQCPIGKW